MTEHTEAQLVEEEIIKTADEAVLRNFESSPPLTPENYQEQKEAFIRAAIEAATPLIQQQVLRDMQEPSDEALAAGLNRSAEDVQTIQEIWSAILEKHASENGIDLTQGEGQ